MNDKNAHINVDPNWFLLTWTRRIIDESELEQRTKHERQTHAGPYVNGLCVRYRRQWRIDTGRLRRHGEQCCDAERNARRHSALIEPERDPRHDYQHAARRVDLDQVVRKLALEQQIHLQATVFTWKREESRLKKRFFSAHEALSIHHGQSILFSVVEDILTRV